MRVPRGREGDYSKAFDIFLLADKEVKTVEKHGPLTLPHSTRPHPFTRLVRKHKVYKQGRMGSKVIQRRRACYSFADGYHSAKTSGALKAERPTQGQSPREKKGIIIFPASRQCDSICSRLRSKNNMRRGETSLQCPARNVILQGHGGKRFSISLALL